MKGTVWPRPYRKDPDSGELRPIPGKSRWYYAFSVPAPTPENPKRRRQITKGGFTRKRDAELALAEALTERGQGVVRAEPSKQTLGVFLVEWLDGRTNLKAATRASYSNAIEHWITPHIGDVRLCDLRPEMITKLYRTLRESGGRSQKDKSVRVPLAEASVHKVHIVLTGALGYAVQVQRLRVNPMTLIPKSDRPKQRGHDRPEMRTWTAQQAAAFLRAIAEDRYAPIYDLCLNTGLRRGELAGLRWEDVDLGAGVLSVRRNRVPVNWQVEEGTPKSTKPRVVDLDPETVAMLRRWRVRQLEEHMQCGGASAVSGYVFTRENGEPLHPETIGWHFERMVKKAGAPAIRLHDLRHTHATLGLAAGVPLKVMSERLGHATTQITADLYQHVIPGMGADAAAKIGALLRAVPL
jgi:integrase